MFRMNAIEGFEIVIVVVTQAWIKHICSFESTVGLNYELQALRTSSSGKQFVLFNLFIRISEFEYYCSMNY